MFCKWCGLESETNDVCSWCRHPFSTPAAETSAAAAPARREIPEVTGVSATEAAPPTPARPAASPVLLGDYDDLEDDFSPVPFGGSIKTPIADLPPAVAQPAANPAPHGREISAPAPQAAPERFTPPPAPAAATPPRP